MKLLFVIKSLALAGGGAERVLCALASELSSRGHDVGIASFDPAGAQPFYPLDQSVTWHRLGIGDVQANTGLIAFGRRVRSLRTLLHGSMPDVAIGFMHSAFVPLAIAAVGLPVRVIASEHTAAAHYRGRPAQALLMRLTAPMYRAHTVISDAVRADFPPAVSARMVTIPNPVVGGNVRRTSVSEARTILCVGGLRPEKAQATLLAAFASIASTASGWKLRMVGDGPLRGELEGLSRALELGERVEFTGAVTDVGPEYSKAAIFVTPSSYESFGLATAEALAKGLPAIGFRDCPGTNELIVDGVNGLLVDGADRVAALAAGLERLMTSPELRSKLGAAGPKSVERYALANVVDRWEAVLQATNRGERISD